MKLVTFTIGSGEPRVGAINLDETRVVDLAAVDNQPYFSDMLSLIESGDIAVNLAKQIISSIDETNTYPLADVKIKSPILVPPQIRDYLCFEEHLINAFAMLRKKKAEAEPDPIEALKRFEKEGAFEPPKIWYEQPLYYKASRFGVIGTDEDVIWPHFSEALDYSKEAAVKESIVFQISRNGNYWDVYPSSKRKEYEADKEKDLLIKEKDHRYY